MPSRREVAGRLVAFQNLTTREEEIPESPIGRTASDISMKKVLAIHYSQSGQLDRVLENFCRPLQEDPNIDLQFENVCPEQAYPFPWPFLQFIDTFPESVYHDAPPLKPSRLTDEENFDLIIIAYQVWFLSPSLPITGFMQSDTAKKVLANKPVVTLIACRNMWLMAQEDMKQLIKDANAKLVGNVALVDEAGSVGSFLATPVWVLTGKQGPHWGGFIPKAGVAEYQIEACSRFGERIADRLNSDKEITDDLLQGLSAVTVDEALISSERTGKRAFKLWGKLFRKLGPQGSFLRKPLVCIYTIFLVLMIVTVVPLGIVIKKLAASKKQRELAEAKRYYSLPSGQ